MKCHYRLYYRDKTFEDIVAPYYDQSRIMLPHQRIFNAMLILDLTHKKVIKKRYASIKEAIKELNVIPGKLNQRILAKRFS